MSVFEEAADVPIGPVLLVARDSGYSHIKSGDLSILFSIFRQIHRS